MRWRRRNGWAVLAETVERATRASSSFERMVALGANLIASNTVATGKLYVIDRAALEMIPKMRLTAEDATEYNVRVPYDVRFFGYDFIGGGYP